MHITSCTPTWCLLESGVCELFWLNSLFISLNTNFSLWERERRSDCSIWEKSLRSVVVAELLCLSLARLVKISLYFKARFSGLSYSLSFSSGLNLGSVLEEWSSSGLKAKAWLSEALLEATGEAMIEFTRDASSFADCKRCSMLLFYFQRLSSFLKIWTCYFSFFRLRLSMGLVLRIWEREDSISHIWW